MNPIDKLDLDARLRSWPSPARDEAAWEERAEAIVKAALVAKDKAGSEVSSALFEAPSLDPEPGEPQVPILTVVSVGEKKMSQESDQSATAGSPESLPPSATPSTVSPKSTERKRGSLKELAARASQAGAASRPGSVTPPPPSATSRTGATGPVSAVAATSTARPSEAGLEDSGIVDLKGVKEKATPEQVAAAEKAKPASKDLFDDVDEKEKPAAAAAAPATVKSPATEKTAAAEKTAAVAKPAAAAKTAEKKKGSSGAVVGGVIAVLGLAAAFAIMKLNKPAQPAPPTPVAVESQPAAPDTKGEQGAQPAPAPQPVAATDTTAEPGAPTEPGETEAAPSGGGSKVASTQAGGNPSAPSGGGPAAGGDKEPAPVAEKPGTTPAPGATTTGAPGDLKGAMAQAVGGDVGKGAPSAENAEPAAGSRNQNIPEQPSQGSVQAAIGTVMGGAKSCVAGADDVSRAQITFASNGTVKGVSVTGWASSHGATGCIKAALQGAKVGPFSKPTYVVGVTIRP